MTTCFVVQGFGKKTDYTDGRILDLDASYAVIKEAVEAAGLECIRADEIIHSGAIDLPMYEQLLRADLVIADLSTYNVNAIFELGVRYGLRPLTDPEFAAAEFEAEVLVRTADVNGCGIRLGLWWKLYPDCIIPDADNALPISWRLNRFHKVRIVYTPGLCRLFVDGKPCGEYPVDPLNGETRPILLSVSR